MSVSLPVAAPTQPLPMVLPPAAQVASTAQPNVTANASLPAATSFANLVDEFSQEAMQPTGADSAAPRILLKTRFAASASPTPATPVAAAPQKPDKPLGDAVMTFLPVTLVQSPSLIVLPTPPPAAPTPAATAPAPQAQSAAPETVRLASDDTVLQIRLHAAEANVPAIPEAPQASAPRFTPKDAAAPAVKPAGAPEATATDDTQVQAAGDESKQTGSQADMHPGGGDSKHLPQRSSSPDHEDISKSAREPFAQALEATPHQMAAPTAPIVEKQLPSAPSAPPPAPAHTAAAEPEPQTAPQQQVRSVSLEFTPDGGRDVRLRVVERGGEVQVTLHSNDADLTGKLREGVQDLAGSLTHAGYEGEAWTPRDNSRQQQQQEQEAPAHGRRHRSRAEVSNEFAGLFSNSVQETK